MQFGMIGLGRMGANMVRRLMKAGHKLVVFDRSADEVAALVKEGATGSASLSEFVSKLDQPRAFCIMVPAAFVDATIAALTPLLGTVALWLAAILTLWSMVHYLKKAAPYLRSDR